jgi:hypothetical protein
MIRAIAVGLRGNIVQQTALYREQIFYTLPIQRQLSS